MKAAILMLAVAGACAGQATSGDFVRTPAAARPVIVEAPPWRRHLTLSHLRVSLFRKGKPQESLDNSLSGARLYTLRAAKEPRPSVDTRVNELGEGAVASIGYHPGVIPSTLGPHELDGAAEPQLGHSESAAGVSIKIPL